MACSSMNDIRCAGTRVLVGCVCDFHRPQTVPTGCYVFAALVVDRPRKRRYLSDETLAYHPAVGAYVLHEKRDWKDEVHRPHLVTTLLAPSHLSPHGEAPGTNAPTRAIDLEEHLVAAPLGPTCLQSGHLSCCAAEQYKAVILAPGKVPHVAGGKPLDLGDIAEKVVCQVNEMNAVVK